MKLSGSTDNLLEINYFSYLRVLFLAILTYKEDSSYSGVKAEVLMYKLIKLTSFDIILCQLSYSY